MHDRGRGGEPDARRLLELARREVLETLLPQLDGEARYRARLVANALKIASRDAEAALATAERDEIDRALHAAAGGAGPLPGDLTGAIRSGRLDGDAAFFEALSRLTDLRRSIAG